MSYEEPVNCIVTALFDVTFHVVDVVPPVAEDTVAVETVVSPSPIAIDCGWSNVTVNVFSVSPSTANVLILINVATDAT